MKWEREGERSKSQDSNSGHPECNDTICRRAAHKAIGDKRSKHSDNKPGLPCIFTLITGISHKNENLSVASTYNARVISNSAAS